MNIIRKCRIKGLIYGFITGFFICLLYLTITNTPNTLPVFELLVISLFVGMALGFAYWLLSILLGDSLTPNNDEDNDDNNEGYVETYNSDNDGDAGCD